jgi:hypothetical protein
LIRRTQKLTVHSLSSFGQLVTMLGLARPTISAWRLAVVLSAGAINTRRVATNGIRRTPLR